MTRLQTQGRRERAAPVRLVRETVAELRKVNWPTRQEALRMTGIVLVVVGITGALLGFLDFVFARLFALLIGAG
ncbi:MAG: preprotein translocase subunit SecE [Anaerolineales bacterium]